MLEIQNNGIAIFDDAFSDEFCDDLIKHFEWSKENNKTWDRQDSEKVSKLVKNDESTNLNEDSREFSSEHTSLIKSFNDTFFDVWYAEYTKYFSVLNTSGRHGIFTHKIQKTDVGGGYHVWHCEAGNMESSRRLGVYILYLNDVDEGGETEFLYLNHRIQPKKGRLVIFPSGYVFTHRGNPPISGEKHIMTGWLEYTG